MLLYVTTRDFKLFSIKIIWGQKGFIHSLLFFRSAFFLYSNDKRAEVRAELPSDAGVGQVAKKLAENWRNVSAGTKAKYEKEAAEDKKRYERVGQWLYYSCPFYSTEEKLMQKMACIEDRTTL